MKYFHIIKHQDKADRLIEALEEYGWRYNTNIENSSFLLSDLDHPTYYRKFEKMREKNRPVFLYQHSAIPNIFPDFPGYENSQYITASFVTAQGHIEISRLIGVTYPIEVIGWHLCPMRDFQPRQQVKNILFAPIHPNPDNSLCSIDRNINIATFNTLLMLRKEFPMDLTVRYIRNFHENGLWEVAGIQFIQGNLKHSCFDFDDYDLVVGHHTSAYKTIARGIPTLMAGENIPPRIGNQIKGTFYFAKSFERYMHLFSYPLDILVADNLLDLFGKTIRNDDEIKDWKNRLIGQPFNAKYFVERVESYL